MVELRVTERFTKALHRLGPEEQLRAAKSLAQFSHDPRHPALHFEKLKVSGLHTIRVDLNFRVVLRAAGKGVFEAIDVAAHKSVDRKYG